MSTEKPAEERIVVNKFHPLPRYVTMSTCNLNQWAMDFDGNLDRIVESIRLAKKAGARLRVGPELEVCGYGCEDHFLESDTALHCWESIAAILESDLTDNILCDIGMPVMQENVLYNCRVLLLNRKILLIRPKTALANDGNYRETRWFTAWAHGYTTQDHYLPGVIRGITGLTKVPFGLACIATTDTVYGCESCEELFTVNNPGIYFGLSGCEIIGNGSASHHTCLKVQRRLDLIEEQTKKNGGIYLYSNHKGCDGGRLYYDGCALICSNGETHVLGSQFSLEEVEVLTYTLDLRDIRNYRAGIASRGIQAAETPLIPRVDALNFTLHTDEPSLITPPYGPKVMRRLTTTPEEEVAYGASYWMWDYLRRSGMQGYFLPLSGGLDSGATAALVGIMCQEVFAAVERGHTPTIESLRKMTKDEKFLPKSAKEICKNIFYCCYMGTTYSSKDTLERATKLSEDLGCTFHAVVIDDIVEAFYKTYTQIGRRPDITHKNSQENIACQNVQARSRMVLTYMMAQLVLCDKKPDTAWPGALLVLGSANLDEGLRGYYTKYDCSSADINPIGSLSKILLRAFLKWAGENREFPTLLRILKAQPTAELQPTEEGKQTQISEDEMGMTFEELQAFGKLRKETRCGPLSMYHKLTLMWPHLSPVDVGIKVKRFFRTYAINRHKMTSLPPAYHLENHSPDDNRYDLRQFLYNVVWPRQFRAIDAAAEMDLKRYNEKGAKKTEDEKK